MAGQSLLTVAGWWVAWVYALSLALPLVLGPPAIPPDATLSPEEIFERWARSVSFEKPNMVVSQSDSEALATLKARATSPAPVAGVVEVIVEEKTAKNGVDFEVAKRGVAIHFAEGEADGTLRFLRGWGPDIRIVDRKDWTEPRSFRLWLKPGENAVPDGDHAMCLVTIDDGPKSPDSGHIPVGFAEKQLTLPLDALHTSPITITAATAVDKPVPVVFDLYKTLDGDRQLVRKFERTFERGMSRMTFRLSDVFEEEELEKLGLVDTGAPGHDQTYELAMLPSRPLFPEGDGSCKIVAENTNPPPTAKLVYLDKKGREIPYLDWDGGSVALEYDRSMANASDHTVTINGEHVGVAKFEAGSRRSTTVSLTGAGLEGRVGRRCGIGTQPGRGCCKGQGSCSDKALCGAPVPGDYMLIVVNNERLHDPGDGIVAEVQRALANEAAKPYGNGAIILNPKDEDTLTPTSGSPDRNKMFQPFSEEGHDVASQLQRIEEVVARKREAAANPNLRAVVVWPERDLAAGTGVHPVAGPDLQPISFLLPDAAPSYARNVERGLVPPGAGPRDVTVRAPNEQELQSHLVNVIGEKSPSSSDSTE